MSKGFALRVDFLMEEFFAGGNQGEGGVLDAEWPPHPLRLFSALVAAAGPDRDPVETQALEWLERHPTPSVCASGSATRKPGVAVPSPIWNSEISERPNRRKSQDRTRPEVAKMAIRYFPAAVPEEPTVWYVWDERPDGETLAALARLASKMTYLGEAKSLVVASLQDEWPEPNYVPASAGEEVDGAVPLRVPYRGRLMALDRLFGMRPVSRTRQGVDRFLSQREKLFGELRIGREALYRKTGKGPEVGPEPLSVPYAWSVVYRFEGGGFDPADTALVAAAFRRALLSRLGAGAPLAVHGHYERSRDPEAKNRPHLMVVPLPFVGWPHADGSLKGLTLLCPEGALDGKESVAVHGALTGLETLHVPGLGSVALRRAGPAETGLPRTLRLETWTGPSRRWASATPVLFERFPKARGEEKRAGELRNLVIESLERARKGLGDEVEGIEISRFSQLEGSPPATDFRLRPRPDGQPERRPRYHVELWFKRPVHGPLVIGAGRTFGLGLLRPLGR